MKEKHLEKIRNYLEISSFLIKNINKWSHIEEIKNTVDKFIITNDKLLELKKDIERDISSIKNNKLLKREDIINIIVPICNVLQVYSFDTNDNELDKKVNYQRYKLEELKDSELIKISKTVYKIAKQLYDESIESINIQTDKKSKKKSKQIINIISYGITDEMILDLRNEYMAFRDARRVYKSENDVKKSTTFELKKLIKDNDSLLENKLDKLMTLFEKGDNKFYSNYLQIRSNIISLIEDKKGEKQKKSSSKTKAKAKAKTTDTEIIDKEMIESDIV